MEKYWQDVWMKRMKILSQTFNIFDFFFPTDCWFIFLIVTSPSFVLASLSVQIIWLVGVPRWQRYAVYFHHISSSHLPRLFLSTSTEVCGFFFISLSSAASKGSRTIGQCVSVCLWAGDALISELPFLAANKVSHSQPFLCRVCSPHKQSPLQQRTKSGRSAALLRVRPARCKSNTPRQAVQNSPSVAYSRPSLPAWATEIHPPPRPHHLNSVTCCSCSCT